MNSENQEKITTPNTCECYCLKCKKKVKCEKVGDIVKTKNNRNMQKYKCEQGHNVCKFVKKSE